MTFLCQRMEWLFIMLAISGTITSRNGKYSIERAVDLASDQSSSCKEAKDFAAGAVLIFALFTGYYRINHLLTENVA